MFFKKQKKEIANSLNDFKKLQDTNIQQIWEIQNQNEFIIAMNGWVSKKCNYGQDMEVLSSPERVFYVCQEIEAEVNNGGFSQFLYNSSGDVANEVVNALSTIGAEKTAAICQNAWRALGDSIPAERNVREVWLEEKLTDEVNQIFEDCEAAFYKYPENLDALNYTFIKENKEYF